MTLEHAPPKTLGGRESCLTCDPDPEGKVARKFGVFGVPETFVIDRNGRIVHRHTATISVREWAHTFRPLIQQLHKEPE